MIYSHPLLRIYSMTILPDTPGDRATRHPRGVRMTSGKPEVGRPACGELLQTLSDQHLDENRYATTGRRA